jgi:hypothetical protein
MHFSTFIMLISSISLYATEVCIPPHMYHTGINIDNYITIQMKSYHFKDFLNRLLGVNIDNISDFSDVDYTPLKKTDARRLLMHTWYASLNDCIDLRDGQMTYEKLSIQSSLLYVSQAGDSTLKLLADNWKLSKQHSITTLWIIKHGKQHSKASSHLIRHSLNLSSHIVKHG